MNPNQSPQFSREYAEIYDLLYAGKNYQNEANLILSTIAELKPGTERIVDYGCGTGNHTKILAEHDYQMFAIDASESMLTLARSKLSGFSNVHFLQVAERDSLRPESADVCICLFDVLSYMNSNEEVNDFLSFANKILCKDGLLFVDFWYGPGVTTMGPERRWKEFEKGGKKLLRVSEPVTDAHNCIVHISHKIWVFERSTVVTSFEQSHNMRYFFPQEIRMFLEANGFELLKCGTWQNPDVPPTAHDWSALVVARSQRL